MYARKPNWHADEENATTWRLRLWLENDEGMYSEVTEMLTSAFKDSLDCSGDWLDRRDSWETAVIAQLEEYCTEILTRNLDPFQLEMMGCSLTWGVNFKKVAAALCDNMEEDLQTEYAANLHPEGYVDWTNRLRVEGSYRAESWLDIWHVDFNIRDEVNLDDPMCIRGIMAEVEAWALAYRSNHFSTRVGQRPKFVALDRVGRLVRIEESAMLHD